MGNAKQPVAKTTVPQDGAMTKDDSDIATLAYQLWTDRGSPIGSPEEDWFRAEEELKGKGTSRAHA